VADKRHTFAGQHEAAGIDRSQISTILISHFHPDHVWGLMEKGTNAPVFPDAELIVNGAEYRWWTQPGRVEKLAQGRRAAGKRIAHVFTTWKNWKLVDDNAEVATGVQLIAAAGHTPGHSAFLVTSDKDQLMVSNDTMYVPALLAPHPEWQALTIKTVPWPSPHDAGSSTASSPTA
jgi:glyoxylase-like metal-dependent hydrolase (beta-lactamase superfamily II)